MNRFLLSNSKPEYWINIGLALVVVLCLFYEYGPADGARMAFALAYFLVLLRTSILLSMNFLLRQRPFGRLDLMLLGVAIAYPAASILLEWPGLLFLTGVGIIGGLFVGVVCGFASPGHRWR